MTKFHCPKCGKSREMEIGFADMRPVLCDCLATMREGTPPETPTPRCEHCASLQAKNAELKEELNWQNHRNSGRPTKGGFEFYINEEWTGLASAALDENYGWSATLRKHRTDPDDERVRVRRVIEDDAILKENASLTAQLEEVKRAVEEVGQHISDDQGFILDTKVSECVCCGKKAPTSSEIAHDIGCFTKAWQDLLAALSPKQKERECHSKE